MKNKKGQLGTRDVEDLFKGGVALIFGIVFLSALVPLVSQDLVNSITNLGIFLIVIAIIIGFISIILRPGRHYT